ncbi:MAG: hypothetical protein FWC19_05780 [Treponema sp.]|nr:hypothetical protein [Treponema sp.]MCL2272298.1 hypothetical protein [Treponema sp.]
MRTFIHGNDKGNALLLSLVLIMALSLIFLSLVPRIGTLNRYAKEYKLQIIHEIENANMEIINRYDLY